jgi:hypothetical protein
MSGDADLVSRTLRDELIATSPLCAAIFEAWPDAAPRVIGDTALIISWFSTGMPQGPAIGDPESITWRNFVEVCSWRRKGGKDGPGFVPARFKLEPDGKHVRRLGAKLIARTAIAIDCETNRTSGEVPPAAAEAAERVRKAGWAGVIYTSHNHTSAAPRYRIVLSLSKEIDHELPAVEAVADKLGITPSSTAAKPARAACSTCLLRIPENLGVTRQLSSGALASTPPGYARRPANS